MGTTTPTRVASLTVELIAGEPDQFTNVGYYVHRDGLDVVDSDGLYLDRYKREEYLHYTATGYPAAAAAH